MNTHPILQTASAGRGAKAMPILMLQMPAACVLRPMRRSNLDELAFYTMNFKYSHTMLQLHSVSSAITCAPLPSVCNCSLRTLFLLVRLCRNRSSALQWVDPQKASTHCAAAVGACLAYSGTIMPPLLLRAGEGRRAPFAAAHCAGLSLGAR